MADLIFFIRQRTNLTQVTNSEWAGPCPWCGGDDRFRVWPQENRYWCRRCHRSGDGIQFCRDALDMTFQQARDSVDQPAPFAPTETHSPKLPSRKPGRSRIPRQQFPDQDWITTCQSIVERAAARIWNPAGEAGLGYLHDRGFTNGTIRQFQLGYVPTDRTPGGIWCPAGITIPWYYRDRLIAVNIRREPPHDPGQKYHLLRGSKNGIYLADTLNTDPPFPLIIVEGELDALSINQEAGDLITAIATGSTTGGRISPHVARIRKRPMVLLGFDADDAGVAATLWWKRAIPHAEVWQPPRGQDWNALLVSGELRGWIADKLV